MQCELDDVNKIHAKRCTPEELRRWCPRKESAQEKKDAEVFSLNFFLLSQNYKDRQKRSSQGKH